MVTFFLVVGEFLLKVAYLVSRPGFPPMFQSSFGISWNTTVKACSGILAFSDIILMMALAISCLTS